MKMKFATALFSLATMLSAEETLIEQPSSALPLEVKPVEKAADKSYSYIRMGISDNDAIHSLETLPGLGLGYRYAITSHDTIDVSANYTREFGDSNYSYTAPRASYLRYFSPAKDQSFYVGAGLAWGGVKKEDTATFQGLVPSATLGYELNRNTAWRSFVQLDVSQPAVAVSSWNSYSVSDLPAPLAEISFGLGF